MESLVFRGLHPGDVRSVLCGSPSVFLSSQVGIQYESALTLICKHKNSIQIRINKCDTCPCNVSVFCDKFYYKHIHTQKGNLLAAAAKSLQSCPTLCNPIDGSPPGSAIPGILQARSLEWVAISFSNAWKWQVKVSQSCPTLSDPMDCSPPGSSIHGIFQARVLEWGAIAFSDLLATISKKSREVLSNRSRL